MRRVVFLTCAIPVTATLTALTSFVSPLLLISHQKYCKKFLSQAESHIVEKFSQSLGTLLNVGASYNQSSFALFAVEKYMDIWFWSLLEGI